jgi:hypothetical protein
MIEIYSIYLKLLGYIPIKNVENTKFYNIINYIHISFIFLIVSFPFFYQFIYYIRNWNFDIIISSFITLLEPVQYLLTLQYFRKNHFNKLILRNGYNKKFIFKLNIMTIIIFFISLIYTIICSTLTMTLNQSCITRNDDKIFNEINRNIYYFILVLHKIVSCNIFFSVNIFFTNTLLLHSNYLLNLAQKIKDDVKNNRINILDICNEYIEQKNYYSKTINKLNNIFSITFLTSGTYIYIVIYDIFINHNNISNYVDYLRIIFYSIMIFIFSYIQSKINKAINNIKDNIYCNDFIHLNLNRVNINYNLDDKLKDELWDKVKEKVLIKDTSTTNPNVFSYIMDKENSQYLDWLVLNSIINVEWEKISFLGFELNGFDMIKQFITIASSLILLIEALKN